MPPIRTDGGKTSFFPLAGAFLFFRMKNLFVVALYFVFLVLGGGLVVSSSSSRIVVAAAAARQVAIFLLEQYASNCRASRTQLR